MIVKVNLGVIRDVYGADVGRMIVRLCGKLHTVFHKVDCFKHL